MALSPRHWKETKNSSAKHYDPFIAEPSVLGMAIYRKRAKEKEIKTGEFSGMIPSDQLWERKVQLSNSLRGYKSVKIAIENYRMQSQGSRTNAATTVEGGFSVSKIASSRASSTQRRPLEVSPYAPSITA